MTTVAGATSWSKERIREEIVDRREEIRQVRQEIADADEEDERTNYRNASPGGGDWRAYYDALQKLEDEIQYLKSLL